MRTTRRAHLVLHLEDHAVLGETEFGMPGLRAIESIGPFSEIQASGPLITVHDATVEPHLRIGHHPHRGNERLFYIERGELDHDDALNRITGHIAEGEVGQFTEGRRGMLHSEWNNGDVPTRAYILVYSTDPVPPSASFGVLRDADAPLSEDVPGARTKELVGPRSPLRVNGDIRLFTDTRLEPGAELRLSLAASEGGLVSVRVGRVQLVDGDEPLAVGDTLIVPPADDPTTITLRAEEPSRVVRVVHGYGHGFVHGTPPYRTRAAS
jgi:redox-sensitive bicupin YhaK (pirin superfamily)